MSRAILVTGAFRGIGRAVAERFAANGDRVALHYGTRRVAAETALNGLAGGGHMLIQGDLSSAAGAATVVADTISALDGLDVVVNNAGTNLAHPLPETSFQDWQAAWARIVNVNLLGAAHVSYCAARAMIDSGTSGHLINIGSRGAFRGEPNHPAYGRLRPLYTRWVSPSRYRWHRIELWSVRSHPDSSLRSG